MSIAALSLATLFLRLPWDLKVRLLIDISKDALRALYANPRGTLERLSPTEIFLWLLVPLLCCALWNLFSFALGCLCCRKAKKSNRLERKKLPGDISTDCLREFSCVSDCCPFGRSYGLSDVISTCKEGLACPYEALFFAAFDTDILLRKNDVVRRLLTTSDLDARPFPGCPIRDCPYKAKGVPLGWVLYTCPGGTENCPVERKFSNVIPKDAFLASK